MINYKSFVQISEMGERDVKVRKFVQIAAKGPNDCSRLMWPFLCLLALLSDDILPVVS